MKTWSFSTNSLEIEYEYDENSIIRLNNYKTKDNICCEWLDYRTSEIVIIKAKRIDNNEDVIVVVIYSSRRQSYGKSGNYDTNKTYHIYNGEIYNYHGVMKTIPKEVEKALKEIKLNV